MRTLTLCSIRLLDTNSAVAAYLDGAGRTKLVEGALGHFGEDPGHRVLPILRGFFGHGQDVSSVLGELAAEEEVHEVDLVSVSLNFLFFVTDAAAK
jgi:hypothetical protein